MNTSDGSGRTKGAARAEGDVTPWGAFGQTPGERRRRGRVAPTPWPGDGTAGRGKLRGSRRGCASLVVGRDPSRSPRGATLGAWDTLVRGYPTEMPPESFTSPVTSVRSPLEEGLGHPVIPTRAAPCPRPRPWPAAPAEQGGSAPRQPLL